MPSMNHEVLAAYIYILPLHPGKFSRLVHPKSWSLFSWFRFDFPDFNLVIFRCQPFIFQGFFGVEFLFDFADVT